METKCESCGMTLKTGLLSIDKPINVKGKIFCSNRAQKYVDDAASRILITTTVNIDGYKVKRYIDIDSVEIVIGTGIFSEFTGAVSDFFGERSTAFEKKLQNAKENALKKLKYRVFEKGGNAVIGIDLDYTEFSGNRIGLIANGTIVEVEPIKTQNE